MGQNTHGVEQTWDKIERLENILYGRHLEMRRQNDSSGEKNIFLKMEAECSDQGKI